MSEPFTDQQLKHLREIMDLRFMAAEATNEVAKLELARRLDLLNHEASRLIQMQGTYVSREIYEQRLLSVEKDLREDRDFRNNYQGRQAVITIILSLAISLGTVVVSWVLKMK